MTPFEKYKRSLRQIRQNSLGLYGTVVVVSNLERSISFYRSLLGRSPRAEREGWAEFQTRDGTICLQERPNFREPCEPKSCKLIIEVVDLRVLSSVIKDSLIEMPKQVMPLGDNGYVTHILDPDGHIIGLYESPSNARLSRTNPYEDEVREKLGHEVKKCRDARNELDGFPQAVQDNPIHRIHF